MRVRSPAEGTGAALLGLTVRMAVLGALPLLAFIF